MIETEFERRIEELKSITHSRGTEFHLWLAVLQRSDGSFWHDWTVFFSLDGISQQFNSRSYDELKIKTAEAAGLDHETREMLLSL